MIDPFDRPKPGPMTFDGGDIVILCEGFDECAVLRKLCADWKPPPKIGTCSVGNCEGEEIKNLARQVKMHGVAVLGFVFDAEKSRATRITKIKKWLKGAGLTPPEGPLRLKRSLLDGTSVHTAYLINPHGKDQGAIETYFLPQIQRTKRWRCIKQLLDCYRVHDATNVLADKVIVRTYIAHKNGRNTGLNAAFNDNILSCDDKSLDPVRKFLSLLCKASPKPERAAPVNRGGLKPRGSKRTRGARRSP